MDDIIIVGDATTAIIFMRGDDCWSVELVRDLKVETAFYDPSFVEAVKHFMEFVGQEFGPEAMLEAYGTVVAKGWRAYADAPALYARWN